MNAVRPLGAGRGALLVLIATLAGMGVTARLGVWQLDRASQKLALQQSLDRQGAMTELPAAELARTLEQAQAQFYRRIRLRGRWMAHATVFLDNRQMNGRPGFYVLTPLRLDTPRGMTVLVQRGWAPRDQLDRSRLPALPAVDDDVTVAGHVAPPPSRLFEFSSVASGPIRQNLDPASYGREIDVPLASSLSIVQDSPADPDDGLLRQWPHPAVDVQMHHGYAFQWFALCALMAGLYVWFQLVRPRLRRNA